MTLVLVHIYHPSITLWNFPPELAERWRARFSGRQVEFRVAPREVAFEKGIEDAEILFGSGLTPEIFERALHLAWIQTASAGIGGLLFPALVESPIQVTNARGVHAIPMAEHLLGLMLSLVRKLHLARDLQRGRTWAQEKLWREPPFFDELSGRTLGIVGPGAVGSALGERARALGMRVIAVRRRSGSATPAGIDEARGEDSLPWLLEESDFVVDCLPLTPRTEGLFDEKAFARMKPDAYFLNVGRGGTVDEPALVRALAEGHLAGAGLDVAADEPLPPESPLYSMPQVILTPHVSGASRGFWERIGCLFEDNLERYLGGQPLLNLVDKREGY